jgi:hypothetical protein
MLTTVLPPKLLSSDLPADCSEANVLTPTRTHRFKLRSLSGKLTAYPMGLSDVHNCHGEAVPAENRSPRGWNGLPRRGKELLEDGIILLYQLANALQLALVFWTVTIPTTYKDGSKLSEDDHRRILSNWSEVVRQVMQEIGRLYEKKGLPNRFLYVIEPQEERWQKESVFSPHIHAILVNRWNPSKRNPLKDTGFQRTGYWEVELTETDQIVERILSHLLGKPVDCRSACNLEAIKGMSRLYFYISKLGKIGAYISKGSQILDEVKKSKWWNCLPPNWYGSDLLTRQEVRASVITLDAGITSLGEIRDQLQQLSDNFQEEHGRPLLTHPHLITVEDESGEMAIALVTKTYELKDVGVLVEVLAGWNLSG